MIAVPIAPPTRRDASPNGSWTGDPNAIVIDDEVGGRHLFVVDGSRLYELDDDMRPITIGGEYLDPEAAAAAIEAVKNQGRR